VNTGVLENFFPSSSLVVSSSKQFFAGLFLFVCLVYRLSIASLELASLKKLGGCDDLVFKLSTQTRDKRAFLVISRHSVSTSQLLSDNFFATRGKFWFVVLSSGCRPGDRSARCESIHEIHRESVVNREAISFLFFLVRRKKRLSRGAREGRVRACGADRPKASE
jgi:hypothetical protein